MIDDSWESLAIFHGATAKYKLFLLKHFFENNEKIHFENIRFFLSPWNSFQFRTKFKFVLILCLSFM